MQKITNRITSNTGINKQTLKEKTYTTVLAIIITMNLLAMRSWRAKWVKLIKTKGLSEQTTENHMIQKQKKTWENEWKS